MSKKIIAVPRSIECDVGHRLAWAPDTVLIRRYGIMLPAPVSR